MDHDQETGACGASEASERTRIVHVTTSHRADDVRIFERECRSLADSGQYQVFLAAHGSIPPNRGVTLIPLPFRPSTRMSRFVSGPQKASALAKVLDAEIWHFHDPELLPVALRLARSGRTVVWDAHEDYLAQLDEGGVAKAWIPRPLRGGVKIGMATLLGAVDRHAAAIVAATPTIAAGYRNRRVVVVGNEARLEDFAGCNPDFSARRVLFAGSPSPGYLFPELVEAVAGLPDVTLAVAGRTPDPAVWAKTTARLGERVTHLGWLDRAGMAREINRSSLGLSTYVDIPTNDVNRPNKMFEAAAAGLPVVATPNRSNREFVEQGAGAFLMLGFSEADLRETIRVALADREEWTRMSDRGRGWAAHAGSWAVSEARLLALYDNLATDLTAGRRAR